MNRGDLIRRAVMIFGAARAALVRTGEEHGTGKEQIGEARVPRASGTAAAYLPGFRDDDSDPRHAAFCWRMLNGGEDVCIRDRGHDNGIHEPGGTARLSTDPKVVAAHNHLPHTHYSEARLDAAERKISDDREQRWMMRRRGRGSLNG